MKLSKEQKVSLALGIIPEGSKLRIGVKLTCTYQGGSWYMQPYKQDPYKYPIAAQDHWDQIYINHFKLPLWKKILNVLWWKTHPIK